MDKVDQFIEVKTLEYRLKATQGILNDKNKEIRCLKKRLREAERSKLDAEERLEVLEWHAAKIGEPV